MLESFLSYTEISLKEISLFSYAVVFLGGILASLSPCIYPVIPITVAYIGANAPVTKARGFFLSLFYVLGISVVYSGLGLIAALGGRLFGEISVNPWTYLVIGNVFLLLGLSMLDLFILPIPGFLRRSDSLPKRKGLFGAFLVGLSAGFIVGPCTAPILGAVLTYVASKQSLFLGVSLLFTFAIGMGLLLMFLGAFIGLAASLPRPGAWSNIIKKIFAITLIIYAEYLIILAGKRF